MKDRGNSPLFFAVIHVWKAIMDNVPNIMELDENSFRIIQNI